MMGVSASVWHGIAPFAKSPVWRRMFCLNVDAQVVERDRWYAALLERGVRPLVASAYLSLAPLLHEFEAINAFVQRHPRWRSALPEILTAADALRYADGDYRLSPQEAAELARLLDTEPAWVLPPVSREAQELGWIDEGMSMLFLTSGDWSVAEAADLPEVLQDAAIEAGEDDEFDDVSDEWLMWATGDPFRILAIEQSCVDGVLLPAHERADRLASAPEQMRVEMDAFWAQCPDHVATLLAHRIYWLARAERGRRRGFADWSPRYPLPPWWEEQNPKQTFERWCVAPEQR